MPLTPDITNLIARVRKLETEVAARAKAFGAFLSTAGGTLTGPLILARDPVSPSEAATKAFVQSTVSAAVAVVQAADVDPGPLGSAAPIPYSLVMVAPDGTLVQLRPGPAGSLLRSNGIHYPPSWVIPVVPDTSNSFTSGKYVLSPASPPGDPTELK